MGYRSDVGFVIEFEDAKFAEVYYTTNIDKVNEKWHSDITEECLYYAGKHLVGKFDNVKWYDSYDDVIAVMNFLHKSADAPGYVGSRFCRVGESTEDIQIEENGEAWGLYEYIDVSVSLYNDSMPDKQEINPGPDPDD